MANVPEHPITRRETYYARIAGQEVPLPESPLTREEAYLEYIAKHGQGGGGGVTDYNDLFDRPQINGKTLTGDKSGAQLGLVDAVQGKGLSTNDYTDAEKTKLGGIAAGAEVNVQSDWNQIDTDADDYIKNKPTIPVITGKADKVSGATNGNLAGLDSNGNLTDSGKEPADFEPALDLTTESVTGNPLSFTTDSEQAARSCVITFEPIQAGSGDPSPSNVRAISGYDAVTLTAANGDDPTAQGYIKLTDINDPLPETLYGFVADVEKGEVTVTRECVNAEDLIWTNSGGKWYTESIKDRSIPYDSTIIGEKYRTGYEGGEVEDGIFINWQNRTFVKTENVPTGKILFTLATPYTLHLTPHQVRLLQGANVVTTNGTTINLTYRNGEVAALSDLSSVGDSINSLSRMLSPYTDFLSNSPFNKNGIFTGRYLGVITAGNIDAFIADHGISTGTFDGLGLGDYFTIQDGYHNTDWMIAGFDQFGNKGGNYAPGHHITLIPRTYLNKPQVSTDDLCPMNSTNTTGVSKNTENPLYATTQGAETAGYQAYYGSDMCQIYLPAMVDRLQQVLGSHLLKTDYLVSNEMDLTGTSRNGLTGFPTGWGWLNNEKAAYAILPTEIEIYGSIVWSHGTYDIGINNKILPVFNFITYNLYSRTAFWLRSVVSYISFAVARDHGGANSDGSSARFYVRPLINIG